MKQIIQSYFDRSQELTLSNPEYRKQVDLLCNFFLTSDAMGDDISTKLIPSDKVKKTVSASISAKQDGIVAGIEESVHIMKKKSSLHIDKKVEDGTLIMKDTVLLQLHGSFVEILSLERTVLNLLQRMSGIATETYRLQKLIGQKSQIAATRKTLWGWLDKKAVAVGGGLTHRLSLSDGILIKDNHIDLVGGEIGSIIDTIKAKKIGNPIEIEVRSQEEATAVLDEFKKNNVQTPLIIMLDNFSITDAKKAVQDFKDVIIELSGGINENNIQEYAQVGADVISLGSLTHSSHSLDLSLQIIL